MRQVSCLLGATGLGSSLGGLCHFTETRYSLKYGGDQMPFRGVQLRPPDIEQQDGPRATAIVPGLMTDTVIKSPALTPAGLTGICPNPQATALGHCQWQVANKPTVEHAGVGLNTRPRVELGKQHRGRQTVDTGEWQVLHQPLRLGAGRHNVLLGQAVLPEESRGPVVAIKQRGL